MTSYFDLHRKVTVAGLLKFDRIFEGSGNVAPRRERKLLSKYTGSRISQREGNYLWPRIADHKWYLSERLSRDVGFRVAAVDYVENFYKPLGGKSIGNKMAPHIETIKRGAKRAIRFYFESKGQTNFQ